MSSRWPRPGEEEALRGVAAQLAQEGELRLGLHALGHDLLAERVAPA